MSLCRLIQALLSLCRLIQALLSLCRLIQALLACFKLIWVLLCPFNLDSFKPIKYILEEITSICIALICCNLYVATVISLQFTNRKFQMYQYLFYDYRLVYILGTVWDTSTSISNSAIFLHTSLDRLKQSRLDFSNSKQTLLKFNYLKSITEGLSFQIYLCQTQVKLSALSSYTTVDRKYQRCKCTMVYLKDSFIVSSFLFLFIHNIALRQGLVVITTIVGVKNP